MHPTLTIALTAAREATRIIRRAAHSTARIRVEEKSENNFVTQVDRAAEKCILEHIQRAFPKHSILAEESGEQAGDQEWQWLIDPLDGTSNFIHDFPHFAVSIACLRKGRVEHAVVIDVMRQEEFTASRGRGAHADGRRLRVSGCEKLQRALVCTGTPTVACHREYGAAYFACLSDISGQASGIRRTGAAALDLAWVAAGRLDAFWEINLRPWDIAAGSLLIRESGGMISDFSGDSNYLSSGNVVCGSPRCFRELLPIIHRHLKELE